MIRRSLVILLAAQVLSAGPAAAQTEEQISEQGAARTEYAYVTDRLLLGLYAEPDGNSRQYRTLPSGAKLEIVERVGLYTRVRTADGLDGWVKSHFLVKDPPAVVRIEELEAQLEQLREAAGPSVDQLQQANQDLQQRLQAAEERLAASNEALTRAERDLEQANRGAVQAEDAPPGVAAPPAPQPTPSGGAAAAEPEPDPIVANPGARPRLLARFDRWDAAGAGAGGLLLGFLVGVRWVDRRLRRRFNGVRVW